MEFEIGIACGQCDSFSPMNTAACPACGQDLSLLSEGAQPASKRAAAKQGQAPTSRLARLSVGASAGHPPRPGAKKEGPARSYTPAAYEQLGETDIRGAMAAARGSVDAIRGAGASTASTKANDPTHNSPGSLVESPYARLSQEELMEQARHYVCKSCSTPVPAGHKFCGRCGDSVPAEILNARTMFFSDMQNPAKAKLILIRGEGMDGLSFHLKAEQHVVGKNGQLVFPDDPFISPKHANFFYRDGKLVVRDEGSLNGVYLRVRGTVEITAGDQFLAGEQLFRLDVMPRSSDGPEQDGTYFYSSPKYTSSFRISQILQGGMVGMVVCARTPALQMGREGGDLNFPGDLFMSGSHCRVEETHGKFALTDLNSRNGTYVRLKTERELGHGDYLFIGRKLLRVELNTN
jgi:pSer/pThr/pTyr-binding forkhead associated (FHA) protein/RNA polymerase subunit RPABC4/transcription elongation factor Spt4